eukprot:scaffold150046_cov22-Tisochrysis_lutea.AAC.1
MHPRWWKWVWWASKGARVWFRMQPLNHSMPVCLAHGISSFAPSHQQLRHGCACGADGAEAWQCQGSAAGCAP